MANPFKTAVEKRVWYPDELEELPWLELVSEEPVDADEIDEDTAQHGDWVRVAPDGAPEEEEHTPVWTGDEVWISAPQGLQKSLAVKEAVPGHRFIVHEARRGDTEHAPWRFTIEHDDDG